MRKITIIVISNVCCFLELEKNNRLLSHHIVPMIIIIFERLLKYYFFLETNSFIELSCTFFVYIILFARVTNGRNYEQ